MLVSIFYKYDTKWLALKYLKSSKTVKVSLLHTDRHICEMRRFQAAPFLSPPWAPWWGWGPCEGAGPARAAQLAASLMLLTPASWVQQPSGQGTGWIQIWIQIPSAVAGAELRSWWPWRAQEPPVPWCWEGFQLGLTPPLPSCVRERALER